MRKSFPLRLVFVAGALVAWLAKTPVVAQQPMPSVIGWTTGVGAHAFRDSTFFEAIDKASEIGPPTQKISAIEGYMGQKVSADIPKELNWELSESELKAVREKLRSRGMSMPAYYSRNLPTDPESAAKLGKFVKALGVQTVVSEPDPATLADLDKIANQYEFNIAIHNHGRQGSPVYWDPKNVMKALEGRSNRMGVCPDIGHWMREGIEPLAGLKIVKDKLLSIHLHDRTKIGEDSKEVPLGEGLAGIPVFLKEVHRLGLKPTMLIIEFGGDVDRSFSFLQSEGVAPIVGELLDEVSKKTPIRWTVTPEERASITAAAPSAAPAAPKKPRRLLVVDLQAAYGGHRSIPHFNVALEAMVKKTGAFEAVFDNDLANLRWDKLRHFDALYLNNTVGPIFNAPDLRRDLLRFVREGGGLAGHHGTSRASRDWAEFGEMLGSHSVRHGDRYEKVVVKVDDPSNPINAAFDGKSFEFTDELFRFPSPPYSREKLRVLLSIDVARTDLRQGNYCAECEREDQDYATSWVRSYGSGRVFFANFGNGGEVFSDPRILEHFLAGIQFVLGDLEVDTTPSAGKPAAAN